MGKVIELNRFRNSHAKPTSIGHQEKSSQQKVEVIAFEQAKVLLLEKERREAQRTILTEFVSAYAVLPERGLLKVELFNISDAGLAFDVDAAQGRFDIGEEVAFRIYLNHKTYFGFTVRIRYANEVPEEGVIRHGTEFTDSSKGDSALQHFIQFIESVSTRLKEDEGDLLIPNIS